MSARTMAWAEPRTAHPSTWRLLVERWTTRLRERAEMATMTSRERKDAGLNAYDVERECRKPFWRE
ncbi:hypothetical protein AAFN86_20380 [Roseomonas sp. CAU 1739]|uniref:DUF1127 domain-containing protein n=1 Tax=Roseomonas sp. CAU 1739 TaxID=3140364 RepID=UPI00325AE718